MIRVLAVLVAATLLAGCGAPTLTPPKNHGVDVGTAALVAQKKQTQLPDCPATTADTAAPHGLPDVSLPCLGGGRSVRLSHLRGPLVINLWAQWCVNCPAELAYYEQFAKQYAGKVGVLGVDWQDVQPAAALRLARAKRLSYPQIADTGGQVPSRGLPKLIMIDKSGAVVFDEAMVLHDLPSLEKLVAQHLGVSR